MSKLNKMYYYTAKHERKLNCYYMPIPKEMVEKAQLQEVEVQLKVENGKIIIERKS